MEQFSKERKIECLNYIINSIKNGHSYHICINYYDFQHWNNYNIHSTDKLKDSNLDLFPELKELIINTGLSLATDDTPFNIDGKGYNSWNTHIDGYNLTESSNHSINFRLDKLKELLIKLE